ncbi:hypothetical protein C2S52_010604 [Perilla frutescens var. hirtella]|nr:hypothetical protein C2S52_010604 [Perilla frutescens var. hirtella]
MENPANQADDGDLDPSLKFAIAMAIVESRRLQRLPPPSARDDDSQAKSGDNSESDAIKWKRKAKLREEEILKLKEDLKIAEDGMHHDLFPQNVSCKCYFYDNLGQLSPNHGSYEDRFNDVLRRRFLRQVRLAESKRRRLDGSLVQSYMSDSNVENDVEQLKASVDFLVKLCETSSSTGAEEGNFKNWSHQAADFILAALKDLSLGGKIDETIESIVNSLIMRLMRRMCNGSQRDEFVHNNFQFYVQHLMRKLGSDPYIGQRVIFSVSQRISIAAESLLFMDPFDNAFPEMHISIYMMIQLIEFLISDYLLSWSARRDFDSKLLEDWVISVFHARKGLELLESRNAVYMLYMDRVVGELTRLLGRDPFLQMLKPDTLDRLFG